jgi:hypothetical protein
MQVNNQNETFMDKMVRLFLSVPMSAVRGLVDFANMLKHMGFTGNPDSVKAALKLGKLAIPPIVYSVAKLSGYPAAELIALLVSPQFWQAYQRLGQVEKQGSPMPLAQEHQSAQEQSINF